MTLLERAEWIIIMHAFNIPLLSVLPSPHIWLGEVIHDGGPVTVDMQDCEYSEVHVC